MKIKINKNITGCMFVISSFAIATPFVISSCSSSSTTDNGSEVISLNKQYLEKEAQYLTSNDALLPKFDLNNVEQTLNESLNNLISNAQNAKRALEDYQSNNSVTQDEKIWLDSYIYQWENKINNIKSGSLFLGANPISGTRILSTSSNHISDFVKSGVNIYPINNETGDPDTSADPNNELVLNLNQKVKETKDIVDTYKALLEFGANQYGYMPCSISKKLFVNQMIQTFYQGELEAFFNSPARVNNMSIEQLTKIKNNNNYFDNVYQNVEKSNKLSNDELNNLKNSLDELKQSLDNFIIFYSSSYYAIKNSFGKEIAQDPSNYLSVSKTNENNAEIEKSIIINGQKIYGLGLTNDDLNTKNIGIGFMKLHDLDNTLFSDYKDPNKIYQQQLQNNNSSNKSAQEIYQQGLLLTEQAKTNMENVANKVNDLIENGLNGQIMYDDDGIGPNEPKLVSLSGTNLDKLNLWLNQEDFFFGRETFSSDQLLNDFINKYWTNPTNQLERYKKTIIQQGYELPWENKTTINGDSTGTVSGNQALAGAVLSYQAYEDFKDISNQTYNLMFNAIPDYVLSPYNYSVREDVGVGLEGPRGSNQFQYNCDPYYSLPKWSLSSLTTHEGKMGHHTQNAYWTKYLVGGNGEDNKGPGYTFVNDSYHEGWAVFAEWYANELGIYGSNLDANSRMPQDFLHAKGLVPKYDDQEIQDNIDQLSQQMKLLHGGVYYQKAKGNDNSIEKLKNSIQLANILQYYGYLNEAQLRNMRLCLDVSIHYNGQNGDTNLPYGASIQDLRNYMKNNSALSVGDINSESIRYTVMPSQATGYMLGKIIFEDLYNQVQNKLQISLNDPNNASESKKLFDLMLRNGEIPLEALQKVVKEQYKL